MEKKINNDLAIVANHMPEGAIHDNLGVPRGDRPPSWKKNPHDKQQQCPQGQQQQPQGDSSQQQKKKHSQGKRGGKAHQADTSSKNKSSNNDKYQASSAIAFASMATIVPPIHPLSPKPQLQARAPKLADRLSGQRPSQVGPIRGPLAHAQEKALKLYNESYSC